MKCQKVYCKKCINNWKKKNSKCPSNCNPPNYQDCLGKKDILSILNFKCKKCGQPINYFDVKKHHKEEFDDKMLIFPKIIDFLNN